MRVAVDAIGGDQGLAVVVPGAVMGARRHGVGLLLTGPESAVRAALERTDTAGVDIVVRDAPEVVGMDEHPAQAARRKRRSSIAVALEAVRDGDASAMVSAGNSGAVMAAALMILGRAPGVERPALVAPLPTRHGHTLVLDLGAVTDPKPHQLVQFAQMGSLYAERALGIARPTVGLLSNGEEATKGNHLVLETYPLLATAAGIDFCGNVEGKDIPRGIVDVVVTDGFTGNVALKVAEGVASFVSDVVRAEVTATPLRKLAAAVLRPAFRAVKGRLDYAETGGATLLGVAGMVVIAHGRSNETAIASAIGVARQGAVAGVAEAIGVRLAELNAGPDAA
ncbi:MAG: phosphate acyltransferase PlsX [Thermomicrobiales bacterium]|nr:phosphate acyltransferase PlsX [Thermomicrobiales bacterium]